MGDTGPFSVNEIVTIPHVDQSYKGKVLKSQFRVPENQWFYFVHYLGWNKKWDEWIEETGLQKAEAGAQPNARRANRGAAGAGAKRKRPDDVVLGAAPDVQVDLEIPAILKQQLVDDHDVVHQDSLLVPLPRSPNVATILDQFLADVRSRQAVAEAEQDLIAGLRLYFDKSLYHCLLYGPERHQADEALAAGELPSSVYGAEHLLRLFVKLPELLPQTGASRDQQLLLARRLEEVLAFLQDRQEQLFLRKEGYTVPAVASYSKRGGSTPPAVAELLAAAAAEAAEGPGAGGNEEEEEEEEEGAAGSGGEGGEGDKEKQGAEGRAVGLQL